MSCSGTDKWRFLAIAAVKSGVVDLLLHSTIGLEFGTKLAMKAVASPASLCALDVIRRLDPGRWEIVKLLLKHGSNLINTSYETNEFHPDIHRLLRLEHLVHRLRHD